MLQFGFDPAQIADAFAPDGQQRTIAMRLSGEAPTAFPAGPPGLTEGEEIPEGHLAASTEPFNAIGSGRRPAARACGRVAARCWA